METIEWDRTFWGKSEIETKNIKVPPLNKMHNEIIERWHNKMVRHGLAISFICMWCSEPVSWQWNDGDSLLDAPLGYCCPNCGRIWRKGKKKTH